MGGSEPFKGRFFIVFHRQYRPPLGFWFWWKVFIFSHLGTGLEVAGVSRKAACVFSAPHIGFLSSGSFRITETETIVLVLCYLNLAIQIFW